jgi:phosphate transport system substrate-binding protein
MLGSTSAAFASDQTVQTAAVDPGTQVSGAGSTFMLNAVEQWKADFKKSSDVTINYAGVGSGAGRQQLIAGTVDFAGSDTAASAAETTSLNDKYGEFVYVPTIAGGIALAFKVSGVDTLKLTASTIAKIFKGDVTNWNDPAITADNGSAGPNKPIQVFVRSDSSGTSNVFSSYLAAAAPSVWTTPGASQFPTNNGQIGKAGSDGVANAVAATDGGIGYVEVSFATERKLGVTQVKNAAGQFTGPTTAAVTAAIDDATIKPDGTLALAFTGTNPAAYPISTTSYFIVPTKLDAKKGENLKGFMSYMLSSAGQDKGPALGYAQLPEKVLSNSRIQVNKVNPAPAATPTTAPALQTGRVAGPSTTPAPKPAVTTAAPKASSGAAGASATAAPAVAGESALARTGAATWPLALAAAGLLLLGGVMVTVTRKQS